MRSSDREANESLLSYLRVWPCCQSQLSREGAVRVVVRLIMVPWRPNNLAGWVERPSATHGAH